MEEKAHSCFYYADKTDLVSKYNGHLPSWHTPVRWRGRLSAYRKEDLNVWLHTPCIEALQGSVTVFLECFHAGQFKVKNNATSCQCDIVPKEVVQGLWYFIFLLQ